MIDDLRANPTVDQRNVALAAKAGEDAFMRDVRSIAQPQSIVGTLTGVILPEVLVPSREDMPAYVGTKVINARPMKRGDYVAFRGWDMPADENPDDAGYLVEYTDKLDGNVEVFAGYVSWSPADVFERAYERIG